MDEQEIPRCEATQRFTDPVRNARCQFQAGHRQHHEYVEMDGIAVIRYSWGGYREADGAEPVRVAEPGT